MTKPIHIINGPNLNLLGTREPEVYGSQTLEDIQAMCATAAKALGHKIVFVQSNIEGELVDYVQAAGANGAGIIINPAAYTHTPLHCMTRSRPLRYPPSKFICHSPQNARVSAAAAMSRKPPSAQLADLVQSLTF